MNTYYVISDTDNRDTLLEQDSIPVTRCLDTVTEFQHIYRFRSNNEYEEQQPILQEDRSQLRYIGDGTIVDSLQTEQTSVTINKTSENKENEMSKLKIDEGRYIDDNYYEEPRYIYDQSDVEDINTNELLEKFANTVLDEYEEFVKQSIEEGELQGTLDDYKVDYTGDVSISPSGIDLESEGDITFQGIGSKITGKTFSISVEYDVSSESLTCTDISDFNISEELYNNMIGTEQTTITEQNFPLEMDLTEDDFQTTFDDEGITYTIDEVMLNGDYIDASGFSGEIQLVKAHSESNNIVYAVLLDGSPDMVDENEDSMKSHYYSIESNPNYFSDNNGYGDDDWVIPESYKPMIESLNNIHKSVVGSKIKVEGFYLAKKNESAKRGVLKHSKCFNKIKTENTILYKSGNLTLTEAQLFRVINAMYKSRQDALLGLRENSDPTGANVSIESTMNVIDNPERTMIATMGYEGTPLSSDMGDLETIVSSINIYKQIDGENTYYCWSDDFYSMDCTSSFKDIDSCINDAQATVEIEFPYHSIEFGELVNIEG